MAARMTVANLLALLDGLPGSTPVKISDWNGYVYDARHVEADTSDAGVNGVTAPYGSFSAKVMQAQDIIWMGG